MSQSWKIYVINLDRRPDRWADISGQLDQLGVDYTRVRAVDGLHDKIDVAYDPMKQSPPEIGVFMSHRKCWQSLLESGDEACIVMEDDAVISPDLVQFLNDPGFLVPDADLIRLETRPEKSWVTRRAAYTSNGMSVKRLYRSPMGAAGYLISRAFAQRVLAATEVPEITIDNYLLHYPIDNGPRPNRYQLDPAVCIQRAWIYYDKGTHFGDSDLRELHVARLQKVVKTTPLMQKLWGRLRKQTLLALRAIRMKLMRNRELKSIPMRGLGD